MRPGDSKSEPKGGKSEAKVSQREPKVSQREPKGSQGESKGSQRATKMHQKVDLRKRSRKSEENEQNVFLEIDYFGSHFPLKIDEKIDAEIDA